VLDIFEEKIIAIDMRADDITGDDLT